MNKRIISLLLVVILMLCGCSSNSSKSSKDYDDEYYIMEQEYEMLIEEYRSKAERYEEELARHEEAISNYYAAMHYYENLCDMYGYQTYESVYYPELWCNYIPKEGNVYHTDWLCPDFNTKGKYSATANPEFYEKYEGYEQCGLCADTNICYLDVKEGVVHSQKQHLNLGTEDFISLDVNYRFVSAQRAVEEGFSLCDSCNFK